jgi:hypothetical protein
MSSMGCNSFPNRWRRLIEVGISCSFALQPAHDAPSSRIAGSYHCNRLTRL